MSLLLPMELSLFVEVPKCGLSPLVLCVRVMQLPLMCVPTGAPRDGEERRVRHRREPAPWAGGGILLWGASPGELYCLCR